jgi:transcriptional regulator with XRE-family HTH domain
MSRKYTVRRDPDRPSSFARSLADRLRRARTEAGISQRRAAAAVSGHIHLTCASICFHEQGRCVPDAETLAAYAAVYHKPVGWFYGDDLAEIRLLARRFGKAIRVGDPHPAGPINAFKGTRP